MTTLLVLYRKPEGGPAALETLERRYREEHMPLVAQTPGLRATRTWRVSEALGSETDLGFVAAMDFDDRSNLGWATVREGSSLLAAAQSGLCRAGLPQRQGL